MLLPWIQQFHLFNRSNCRTARRTLNRGRRHSRSCPSAEVLEERTLLTAYVVDSIVDDPSAVASDTDAYVSLREAINASNTNAAFGDAAAGQGSGVVDTITFDASLTGQTIVLGGEQLVIGDDLSIVGLGQYDLTISGNNASRVFQVTPNTSLSLSKLSVTDGNAGLESGGGIWSQGILTLSETAVLRNTALSGGGIETDPYYFADYTSLTLSDSIVSGNYASGYGGGMHLYGNDESTIINSEISGNMAAGNGGGISFWYDSSVTISGSTIMDNFAGGVGGGIEVFVDTYMLVTESVVSGNSSDSAGGGIFMLAGGVSDTLTVSESEISNNTAFGEYGRRDGGGGGIWYAGGTLSVINSSVTSNSSTTASGGGIFGDGATTITGSTISNNFAAHNGGGVASTVGSLTIAATTISSNEANGNGGGVYSGGPYGGASLQLSGSTNVLNRADADGDAAAAAAALRRGWSVGVLQNSLIAGNVTAAATVILTTSPVISLPCGVLQSYDAATAGGLMHGVADIVSNSGVGTRHHHRHRPLATTVGRPRRMPYFRAASPWTPARTVWFPSAPISAVLRAFSMAMEMVSRLLTSALMSM
jgi:parallel beta-helix repeat protein